MIHPDTVLHRGRIYTVDSRDSVVEALAIASGQIVATGTSEQMLALAGPRTRRIDLGQRAVIPGFVDGHPHLDGLGIRLIKPAFNRPKSIDDILSVVREEVARRKPGEWIVCNPIASEPE
ncbi:MAG TPA: amidohydrolase family protein, partial [Burkholderiaceae bacterium]|nr:amidohydrolase family protein [Burkholderiaceae bacterium]